MNRSKLRFASIRNRAQRVDHDRTQQPLGCGDGKVHSQVPTPRVSNDPCPRDAEAVEYGKRVRDVILNRRGSAHGRRGDPALLKPDCAEASRDLRREGVRVIRQSRATVQDQRGRAVTQLPSADFASLDPNNEPKLRHRLIIGPANPTYNRPGLNRARNPDDEWRVESDGTGELLVFCPVCWQREFGSSGYAGSAVERLHSQVKGALFRRRVSSLPPRQGGYSPCGG